MLIPFPFCPLPPSVQSIPEIRLPEMIVPSAPASPRHTLTPPAPDKWKKNAAEIEPLLAGLKPIRDRLAGF